MNRHPIRGYWHPILPAVPYVPACLCFAMSSRRAETKARKVTFEGPRKKYEVRTIA